jgi:hypothetical protein
VIPAIVYSGFSDDSTRRVALLMFTSTEAAESIADRVLAG